MQRRLFIATTVAAAAALSACSTTGSGGWVTLIVYALGAWALCFSAVALASRRRALAFPAACAAFGVMLLYGSELFLIKDVFFSSVPRLNTIFKLSYQAWVLLSLGGAVGIVQALRNARKQPLGYVAVPALGLVSLGLCYPLLAAFNRTWSRRLQKDQQSCADTAIVWIEVRHIPVGVELNVLPEGVQWLHMRTVKRGQPLRAGCLLR